MTRALSHTIIRYRPEQGTIWMASANGTGKRALNGFALPTNSERKQFDTRKDRRPIR
jgi:hypothetical protein